MQRKKENSNDKEIEDKENNPNALHHAQTNNIVAN
jgi:hypothetical protein